MDVIAMRMPELKNAEDLVGLPWNLFKFSEKSADAA
jgi:hypothetical protein